MMRRLALVVSGVALAGVASPAAEPDRAAAEPTAVLWPVEPMELPGPVDSNSPVVWDRVDGRRQLFVLTSFDGRPSRASGSYLTILGTPKAIDLAPWPGGGVWMEAIVADHRGVWYGFYHNENPAPSCGGVKPYARIGAARSRNHGETWDDLGIILDAPPETFTCATPNRYFVGGVGDMSVLLEPRRRELYIYFSQYGRTARAQGVGVARLLWANRDEPVGTLSIWRDGVWLAGTLREDSTGPRWVYPTATPLVAPRRPWHDPNRLADAFWGPSIHWNTFLRQYVMLLNRAKDEDFGQEGIYVAFSPRLDDPTAWSPPRKILDGGSWYPQVAGLEVARGTDTWAGRIARFFMSGRSNYVIEFRP